MEQNRTKRKANSDMLHYLAGTSDSANTAASSPVVRIICHERESEAAHESEGARESEGGGGEREQARELENK